MVTAIRKVNTEINFPESLAPFYSIGQDSACSGVLLSAHTMGADPQAAGQLHLVHSATLLQQFLLFFLSYKPLLSLTKSFTEIFPEKSGRFEISHQPFTSASKNSPQELQNMLYQTCTEIVLLLLLFLTQKFLMSSKIINKEQQGQKY